MSRISIHALLAESDRGWTLNINGPMNFYPRSPCGERLVLPGYKSFRNCIFLSTLSLRRATCSAGSGFCRPRYFYPRSPCGERLYDTYAKVLRVNEEFLSTLSLRRATIGPVSFFNTFHISIHALLTESDISIRTAREGSDISIHALLAESDYMIHRLS